MCVELSNEHRELMSIGGTFTMLRDQMEIPASSARMYSRAAQVPGTSSNTLVRSDPTTPWMAHFLQ